MEVMDIEKTKKLYEGKDMVECFATLQLNFQSEISGIKEELKDTKAKVANLECFTSNLDDSLKEVYEKHIPNIEERIEGERRERLCLENWGRKWNVIIRGLEGTVREQGRETEQKVRAFLKDTLRMNETFVKSLQFQAVHRLPGGIESKKTVIVRFVNLLDRDDVLKAARQLPKGCGFSVVPDLPPEASKLRSNLLQKLREMPEFERKKHKLIYNKEFPFVALIKRERKN